MQLIKIRRILFLTTLIVVLLCSYSSAQVYNWKRLKYEGYIGLGATNFIGDAGAKKTWFSEMFGLTLKLLGMLCR